MSENTAKKTDKQPNSEPQTMAQQVANDLKRYNDQELIRIGVAHKCVECPAQNCKKRITEEF